MELGPNGSVMPDCRNCGELVYLAYVLGIRDNWRHWKTGAICCDQTETIMAEPKFGELVQCKVTAATVNYPCAKECDPACAPGSKDAPTMKYRWVGISMPVNSVEDVL